MIRESDHFKGVLRGRNKWALMSTRRNSYGTRK